MDLRMRAFEAIKEGNVSMWDFELQRHIIEMGYRLDESLDGSYVIKKDVDEVSTNYQKLYNENLEISAHLHARSEKQYHDLVRKNTVRKNATKEEK